MADCRCPTCGKPFDPAKSAAMPFCSERCRLVDLGNWLGEKHGLPWEPADEPDAPHTRPDPDCEDGR